ncbi:hypothetical protein AB0L40_26320 [Patulibacter sp. NPDC049589]|uniref:hypothetical protein n=1 Tax=Patulibacter sp. NPDC049589 TaxID=3154731 RepID=UPI00341902CB
MVEVEDRGDELVLRPAPDDPVAALQGIFAGRAEAVTTERALADLRADDAAAEVRRPDAV